MARPDEKWGETPCALITLKEGANVTEQEIIDFCRQHLAHFKAPRTVVFGPLPKPSTGKLQKFKLRDQAKAISAPSHSLCHRLQVEQHLRLFCKLFTHSL